MTFFFFTIQYCQHTISGIRIFKLACDEDEEKSQHAESITTAYLKLRMKSTEFSTSPG